MSKLEETNTLINAYTKTEAAGIKVDNRPILLDIAKSLAMIADRLSEKEEKESEEV